MVFFAGLALYEVSFCITSKTLDTLITPKAPCNSLKSLLKLSKTLKTRYNSENSITPKAIYDSQNSLKLPKLYITLKTLYNSL